MKLKRKVDTGYIKIDENMEILVKMPELPGIRKALFSITYAR